MRHTQDILATGPLPPPHVPDTRPRSSDIPDVHVACPLLLPSPRLPVKIVVALELHSPAASWVPSIKVCVLFEYLQQACNAEATEWQAWFLSRLESNVHKLIFFIKFSAWKMTRKTLPHAQKPNSTQVSASCLDFQLTNNQTTKQHLLQLSAL